MEHSLRREMLIIIMTRANRFPGLLFVNGLVRRTAVRFKIGFFFLIQPSNRFHGRALGFKVTAVRNS